MYYKWLYLWAIAACCLILAACKAPAPPDTFDKAKIAEEFSEALTTQLLDHWYPACIDSVHGGYLSNFAYDWTPDSVQHKMIVTQGRHMWTAAKAAEFFPEEKEKWLKMAAHGYEFLRDHMWDMKYGGFFWQVDQTGDALNGPESWLRKSAYGNAFGIYGLAAYYHASHDEGALELAKWAFQWLDEHAYDSVHLGYFTHMTREGKVIGKADVDMNNPGEDRIVYKDQNPTIHLLEAFAELYEVWPDERVKARLLEQLHLIRDVITHDRGYMRLYFELDWTPVSFRDSSEEYRTSRHYDMDHVSPGHDIETAFLIYEAAGLAKEADKEKTLAVGKKMVDHTLAYGYDQENGGFYEQLFYNKGNETPSLVFNRKNWWAQAEGMHALLLFSTLFPEEKRYEELFLQEWEYIKTYLIDPVHGGWYANGLDIEPRFKTAPKGGIWKGNYHNGRSLMRCIELLKAG